MATPPLHAAARNGHLNPVKLLLEAGAETDPQTEADRITPLHFASAGGHMDVVQFLVDAGADKEKASDRGLTPLLLAVHQVPSRHRSASCLRPARIKRKPRMVVQRPC